MATSTIVENIRAYLATNLPAALTAASLSSMNDYAYGLPVLGPKDHLPRLGVEGEAWRLQMDELSGLYTEVVTVVVLAGYDGSDPDTVGANIHKLGDAIRKVLTASPSIAGTNTYLQVVACDFSPPVTRAGVLTRFCLVTAEVTEDYAEGG